MRNPADELHLLAEAGLLRTLKVHGSERQTLINFSSNDYLGLAQHPKLKQAATEAILHLGTGAGSARLICGTLPAHHELEEFIASLKKTDGARFFANGYQTALGVLPALVKKGDTVILDKLTHACLIDGARLSGATLRAFPHNRLDRLEAILQQVRQKSSPDARILIITESVFSMDGDTCPLPEIITLKKNYGALLLIDEAHALGVLGPSGLGLAEELGLSNEVDFHMGTLGKAAGAAGGYLATSQDYLDLITNQARSFIYSTAPPPAQVAAARAGLELITSAEGFQLRKKLREHIEAFHLILKTPLPEHPTAIIPYPMRDSEHALTSATMLEEKGFLIPAIRYPTVPRNGNRLRITLSAQHNKDALTHLGKVLREL